MMLEGQFTLPAPIQQVWDTILNPEVLAACVPGCEKLEVIDDKTYASIVAAKVGSISARFQFTTKITETDPPRHLKASGSGTEMSKLATFSQDTVIDLEEISAGEVKVSYRANVSIVGKLATFGDRIMKAKAAQVQAELTRALAERLSTEAAAAPDATPAPAPDHAPATPDATAPDGEPDAAAPGSDGEPDAAAPGSDREPDAAAPGSDGEPEAAAAAGSDREPEAPRAAAPRAALAPARAPAAPARVRTTAIKGTPAIKVTFWEMITVFFAVLWDKITRLFKGSRK